MDQRNIQQSYEEKIIKDNLFDLEPGPGYYFSDSQTMVGQVERKNMKKKQMSFGTTEKRSCSLISKDQENFPGPGNYYGLSKPAKKPKRLLRKTKDSLELLNLCKLKKDFCKYNIGPGSYDQSSIFDNIQKETYVGSHEIRFKNNPTKLPGPGSYISLSDWTKERDIFPERRPNENRIYKTKYNTPGVGSYRNDVVNSIQYRVQAKSNLFQSLIAPFNSCEDKLLSKSKSTANLISPGPGSYNINLYDGCLKISPQKKIEKVEPLKEWVEEKNIEKGMRGPGSYFRYNYNDWNKKSYNILYV